MRAPLTGPLVIWGSRSRNSRSGVIGSSDAQEDFALVHPVEDQPVAGEDGEALDRGRRGDSEEFEGVGEEAFEEVGHAVGGDGVHADDGEGESPLEVRESGEEEEADAAAEEDPGRGPDSLDDRADAEGGGDEEAFDGDFGGGGFEPASGGEAEDHGGEGRDEAEGEVSAGVGLEGFYAGEEVKEPDVEGPT